MTIRQTRVRGMIIATVAATALGAGMMIFASQSSAGTTGQAAAEVTLRPMFTQVPPVAPAVELTVTGRSGGVALVEWTEGDRPDGVTFNHFYVSLYDATPPSLPTPRPGVTPTPTPGSTLPPTPIASRELPATARSTQFTGLDPALTYGVRVWASGPKGQSGVAEQVLHKTTLAPSAAPATATAGASVTVSGSGPRAGEPILIERRAAGTPTWTKVTTLKTGANLRWSLKTQQTVSTAFRATYAGSEGQWPASSSVTVTVRFAVTIKASTTKPKANQRITVTGAVRPAQAGAKVSLQRYAGGKWGVVAVSTVKAGGSYAIPKTITKGTWPLRVVATGGKNVAFGTSGQVTVVAR
ncbi:hypothetical protein OWR29_34470 [Actinoplanes sp. Pm04-4]|uniref:Fibronectin type-III domain-containing protein n=1 Tax=Paractinoplanes pyxinae TaxID=2997416 RepID=A0ABT4B9F5_9ACTN|nr:hypothetical protein [Actinoplanes pyxinae]MCY1143129.1 hypothetical protein [Actinoplanes pyxinae]